MVWTTMLFGVFLAAVGVAGYFVDEQTFWPALIPAVLGVLLLVAGVFGLKQSFHKNAMHAAVLLALLGLVGTVHAVLQLVQLVLQKPGLVVQSITAILCGVFTWLAIRSFIDARRRPATEQPPAEAAQPQPNQQTEVPRP